MQVEKGSFTCIVGENGSGKSTLIKILLGLNEGYTGYIRLETKVGYLSQKTEVQSKFPASIYEVVLSGTISDNIKGIFYRKKDKEKAQEIMKKLEIFDIRKKCFADLSGGQQQRVLIARAMCASDNKLIVLDEPTNGLDPKIAKQIYEMLNKLKEETGLTILMVSHDIDRALNYADHVVEILNGKIDFDGKPSEYSLGGGK